MDWTPLDKTDVSGNIRYFRKISTSALLVLTFPCKVLKGIQRELHYFPQEMYFFFNGCTGASSLPGTCTHTVLFLWIDCLLKDFWIINYIFYYYRALQSHIFNWPLSYSYGTTGVYLGVTWYSQVPSSLLASFLRSLESEYLILILFPCLKGKKIWTGLQWYQKCFLTTWWWPPVVLLITQNQSSPLFQRTWSLLNQNIVPKTVTLILLWHTRICSAPVKEISFLQICKPRSKHSA